MDKLEEIHYHDTLIVSFGGYAQKFGGIQPYEFLSFLNKNFPKTDKLFLKDTYCSNYHRGIRGISTSVETTVDFLKTKINVVDISGNSIYRKVLFLGNSAGGYAALLFGSLLNVNFILAFVPQTILYLEDKNPLYKNLAPFINEVTKYYVYGDLSVKDHKDPHHISHCENINKFNVTVIRKDHIDLKKLRDSGELKNIIEDII